MQTSKKLEILNNSNYFWSTKELMMMNTLTFRVATFFLFLLFLPNIIEAQKIPTVIVSILPQQYFVQCIAKDRINVEVLVQPGASPATYEPTPLQMAIISKAPVFFSIGVPFEKKWLPKIGQLYPNIKIIQTDKGIEKIPINNHTHDHGKHHKKIETEHLDPHIWLSPPLVMMQIRHILLTLQFIDPKNKQFYEQNYRTFMIDLIKLDMELRNMFDRQKQYKFMVFHPSWGYFAQAYGLRQCPIEIEGKDIKPSQLTELIKMARTNNIRIIFAQPQFSSKSAQLIAQEIGGQIVFIDPLALDWENNLRTVSRQILSHQ
ncbi:cation ABC transporter substrate-binding protein [Candidatus Magnetomorum sp. HK-1]|nr:cation ABC transporter substrate-binding protein [Candidatus Magnetomorum sp. HK-1]